jgi:hypothetical protein
MKKITQSIEYEGLPFTNTDLHIALKEFHAKHPFSTGVDWEFQTMWAVMKDEDAFAFALKYPQYSNRFKDV